ncbi:hypothetical protein [Mucilaginibacter sp. L3T2-6]|uniref:hypothetical protein n=1 Tax=Mucilaginibacter sp. L3T2-6 TaxID=3062491 RepID=UPI0026760F0A|nr:hypothetical protein [Mucilaginibacter sp. L3T2-6]MDO3642127.1 hypothetical protein [Mucilaginibacter sp. L3T2-6]MDV6214621.1 hypothetical protein [Mucilaginibacter sp. L3T2-6]
MKTLLNKWFIAGCLVWLLVFITRKLGHPLPQYINGYISDFFAIPVIANLALCFQRIVVIKSDFYTLSIGHIAFITAYVSLVFEVLLPAYSKTYTKDWLDIVLYVIGAIFFYKVMNKPVLEIRR